MGARQAPSKATRASTRASKARRALSRLGIILFTSSAVIHPTIPTTPDLVTPPNLTSVFPSPASIPHHQFTPHDTSEELRAYHSYLYRLNDMFNPDTDAHLWTPKTILSHHVHTALSDETKHVYLKIMARTFCSTPTTFP